MHAHEIWQCLTPLLNHDILESAYLRDKKLYRLLVEESAKQLRQRTQKILEMPRKERHAHFMALLGLPAFGLIAQNLLTHWLFNTQGEMMGDFMNQLGIAHDGQGRVDELPENVDKELIKKGVTHLYSRFPKENVSVYLHVLNTLGGCDWPVLKDLIQPLEKVVPTLA